MQMIPEDLPPELRSKAWLRLKRQLGEEIADLTELLNYMGAAGRFSGTYYRQFTKIMLGITQRVEFYNANYAQGKYKIPQEVIETVEIPENSN